MTEGELKSQIMDYLQLLPKAYFRIIQVKGIKGRTSPTKGVLDIIGVYRGMPWAIEVKLPGGRVSTEQSKFISSWESAGGRAIVATSLEYVQIMLPFPINDHESKH